MRQVLKQLKEFYTFTFKRTTMKKLVFLVFIFLITSNFSFSQVDNPESKPLTKEEKKALKNAKKEEKTRQKELALSTYTQLLHNKEWVVEAHTVYNKAGGSIQMDPTINFVGVKDDLVVVQLSFSNLIGWNGVGGITVEGKPGKYEVKSEKNAVSLRMSAMGSAMGPVDIFLTVSGDGTGRATVSGNFGERITFAGYFVSLNDSRVFKGTTTY